MPEDFPARPIREVWPVHEITLSEYNRAYGAVNNSMAFSWTLDALLNGAKTQTGRFWRQSYAERFDIGSTFWATDKTPRSGGKRYAVIMLTEKPVLLAERSRPASMLDYQAEGFGYLSMMARVYGEPVADDIADLVDPARFLDVWPVRYRLAYVMRFRVIAYTDLARDRFDPDTMGSLFAGRFMKDVFISNGGKP